MSRRDKKNRMPKLANLTGGKAIGNAQLEGWKQNAPRLTEDQKQKLQTITRETYAKIAKDKIQRNNFEDIHYALEDELADRIALEKDLGLVAAIEWRCSFPKHVAQAFNRSGLSNNGVVEGILPTRDFLDSTLFDYIEVFSPILILFQFDEYDKHMKSTEQSVGEAERRRGRGDAYFTDRDRQINYRPQTGNDDQD